MTDEGGAMNAVLEQIWAHRSIRACKPDAVPDELLDELLEAGLRAASCGNMQTWSVIVTRAEERRAGRREPGPGLVLHGDHAQRHGRAVRVL
jgi:nitroreductase